MALTGHQTMHQEEFFFVKQNAALKSVVPGPVFETPPYTLITQPSQLDPILPHLVSAPALACDTETTGLNWLTDTLRLVQLATPDHVYVIDVQQCPLEALTPLFAPDRIWLFHNAKFDLKFLLRAGLPWPTQVFDTMLASQLLTAGLRAGNSLGEAVTRELGLSLPKTEQTSDWRGSLSREQLDYAAKDVAVLWPLYERFQTSLKTTGLERVAEIEFRCLKALVWLEMAGMAVDAEQWLARTQADEARLRELTGQLNEAVNAGGIRMNWSSPKQVKALFQSRQIMLPNTRTQTLRKIDHPLARLLVAYKETEKRVSSFGRSVIDTYFQPETGRVYPIYFQNGTTTGRMSCGGPNIQQIPKGPAFRACFRAPQGRALIKADYSQIELRIAAVLANDATMLGVFRHGTDLHALTASRILHLPLDQVQKQHRQLAKSVNFGLLYGMGAPGLKRDAEAKYGISMTDAEARQDHHAFFQTYQGIRRWHDHAVHQLQQAQRTHQPIETRTFAGRRFLGVRQFNALLNIPVQGTGGDGIKLALARLFEHADEAPHVYPVACVHDEVVVECPAAEAAQAAAWVHRHMREAMQEIVGDTVPIEVEATIGKDWAGTALRD